MSDTYTCRGGWIVEPSEDGTVLPFFVKARGQDIVFVPEITHGEKVAAAINGYGKAVSARGVTHMYINNWDVLLYEDNTYEATTRIQLGNTSIFNNQYTTSDNNIRGIIALPFISMYDQFFYMNHNMQYYYDSQVDQTYKNWVLNSKTYTSLGTIQFASSTSGLFVPITQYTNMGDYTKLPSENLTNMIMHANYLYISVESSTQAPSISSWGNEGNLSFLNIKIKSNLAVECLEHVTLDNMGYGVGKTIIPRSISISNIEGNNIVVSEIEEQVEVSENP